MTIHNTQSNCPHRHDGNGKYLALESVRTFGQQKVPMTNTASFYSPMMTSQNGQNCRMRLFYFINGEPLNISKSHLDIYIQYANKLQPESQPVSSLSINIQSDLQQRWLKAVVPVQSAQPFQFVFRGYLGTNLSRIAVDDISYDLNCATSSVQPLTTTPRPTAATNPGGVTGFTDGHPVTFTNMPTIGRQKDKSGSGIVGC